MHHRLLILFAAFMLSFVAAPNSFAVEDAQAVIDKSLSKDSAAAPAKPEVKAKKNKEHRRKSAHHRTKTTSEARKPKHHE